MDMQRLIVFFVFSFSLLMLWEAWQREADGSVEVTAAAPDLNWLASLVLGFAGWVRVLEPPELREMVRKRAQEIVRMYERERF